MILLYRLALGVKPMKCVINDVVAIVPTEDYSDGRHARTTRNFRKIDAMYILLLYSNIKNGSDIIIVYIRVSYADIEIRARLFFFVIYFFLYYFFSSGLYALPIIVARGIMSKRDRRRT